MVQSATKLSFRAIQYSMKLVMVCGAAGWGGMVDQMKRMTGLVCSEGFREVVLVVILPGWPIDL
jgi:hypothetical protein